VPNQSLSVLINQQVVNINLYTRTTLNTDYIYADILLGNEYIIAGTDVTGLPIIPYSYLSDQLQGNFVFLNTDGNNNRPINYKNFGINQVLIFFNFSEV
jgi:hypothetical protein